MSKSYYCLPEGELPVILRLHIVVERSISDWQRKTSIAKTIFREELTTPLPLATLFIFVSNTRGPKCTIVGHACRRQNWRMELRGYSVPPFGKLRVNPSHVRICFIQWIADWFKEMAIFDLLYVKYFKQTYPGRRLPFPIDLSRCQ